MFGITRATRGAPRRHYQRDQNVMRVVRVLELMDEGIGKEDALPQAAKELGDVAESTLPDLYKKHKADAARFLRIERDYADEDSAIEDPLRNWQDPGAKG